ncbi:MAG: hypothetical protein ACKVP0_14375 [Pirellulaceae bacterium]
MYCNYLAETAGISRGGVRECSPFKAGGVKECQYLTEPPVLSTKRRHDVAGVANVTTTSQAEAHRLDQPSPALAAAIRGNVGSIIAFAVGTHLRQKAWRMPDSFTALAVVLTFGSPEFLAFIV